MDNDIAKDFIRDFKWLNEKCASIRRQYDGALDRLYTRMRKDYNSAKEDALIKAKIEFLKKHCPLREGDVIACEDSIDNFEGTVKEIHITDGLLGDDHLLIWLEEDDSLHIVTIKDIDKVRIVARFI